MATCLRSNQRQEHKSRYDFEPVHAPRLSAARFVLTSSAAGHTQLQLGSVCDLGRIKRAVPAELFITSVANFGSCSAGLGEASMQDGAAYASWPSFVGCGVAHCSCRRFSRQ